MNNLLKNGKESELSKMIGEGIDMRKLVRLNKMTKESGIKQKSQARMAKQKAKLG